LQLHACSNATLIVFCLCFEQPLLAAASRHPAALPRCCSELLLFLLPLVNVRAIKHTLRSYLPRLPILSAAGSGSAAAAAASLAGGGSDGGQPCGICSSAEILTPYAAEPCGHCFCYYCLRAHCLADAQYSCPLCLRRVEAMRRVLDPAGTSSGSEGSSGAGNGAG
jgi:peroxin-2